MREVVYHTFVGEGPENDAFLACIQKQVLKVHLARKFVCEKYGARGMLMDYIDHIKPIGLYYEERQNRKYFKGEEHHGDKWVYFPKLSTKIGKELQEDLDCHSLRHNTSNYILTELNLNYMTSSSTHVIFPTAGCTDKHVLLHLPISTCKDLNDKIYLERVPSWFREVTETECDKILNSDSTEETEQHD